MTAHKIIAVVGATGAQGGGLARAILTHPDSGFRVRAITRDATSVAARKLAAAGAEVVTADLGDSASLSTALREVWGAYFMTCFQAHFCPATEKLEARTMAAAARRAHVRHVIWSTLEDTRTRATPRGSYNVPHCDAKGEADGYFRELDVPTTFLRTSFHWENFIDWGLGPRLGPHGNLVLTMPIGTSRLAGIAAEDIGRCAFGIFSEGTDTIGCTIGIAGEHLTGDEMAAKMGRATGHTTIYHPICPDRYRELASPGSLEMGNWFQYQRDTEAEYCSARSVERSRSLNPQLQSFDAWLAVNAGRIPGSVVTY
ncbi:MAG: NmrA family NAD(P)-binding protein [Gemmatimonadaceae bacterium]|nr:NmrA family NAD(P)-binding protein [Gemmatimonadaceae bacterium]